MPRWAHRIIRSYTQRSPVYAAVFVVYLLATLFSSYMYHIAGTQPAVILAPQGIALAAALVFGYATIPITALATMLVSLYAGNPPLLALATLLANLVQPALTLYLIDRFRVSRALASAWDFYLYIGIAFVTSMIVPTVSVYGREIYNNAAAIPVDPLVWINLWIAGLVSALIIAPFLVRLLRSSYAYSPREWMENIAAIALLNIPTAALTYTPSTSLLGINLLIPFLLFLMWIALRGGTFFVTFAMVTVSISAISGRILGHPANPQNMTLAGQIANAETSLIVFALLFYFIAALEEGRRAANKKLHAYTEGLEKTVSEKELDAEAKNEFIATLGHEIRNPLASLLSSVELLKLPQSAIMDRAKIVGGMEERIRSINRLLDDMFDISQITKKKIVLQKEILQARVVLEQAIETINFRIAESQQRFLMELPEDNVLIHADPVRIEQVFTNLLHNATKYTPAGGTIEFLSAMEGRPGKSMLVTRVIDTGIGLTKDEQGRIFEPFTQINPKQSLTGGIGLGLTLARTILEMHGGTIDVTSNGPGHGSEFVVRIPAILSAAAPQKKPQPSLMTVPQGQSVLVVDDNVNAAETMCKLLQIYGYEAVAAHSGGEGIEKAQEMRPRAIVLDIGLPDMDGYEVAKRLRARESSSTIIALSGYGPDHSDRSMQEAGFDHYLTKPASIEEILKVIG